MGFTLSYATLYMVVHFGFGPTSISEHFTMSTPVGYSMVSRRVYRGCVVYVGETLVDLFELDIVNFDVILGIVGYANAIVL